MAHVFISYSRKDQDYARKLAEDLRQHGFDVWIDDRIDYGDQWFNEIVQAIENCGAFVIVMSPDAEKSKWVQREILLAQRRNKPIIPMLLEGEEFPLLIDIQFVDVRGGQGQMPGQDFYARLESVIEPAEESGVLVAPSETEPKPKASQAQPQMSQSQQQSSPGLPRGLLAMGILLVVVVIAVVAGIFLLGDDGDSVAIPTEIAFAFTPVPENAEWSPVIEQIDGVEMVLVPAGCFMMGSEDGTENELPVHDQCFDEPFWIDRLEVTNEQYGSVGCEDYSSAPEHPRNCVTWDDAVAFCEERGARLPTEAEWEYAARGPDNLTYPWGDEFVPDFTVYEENSGDHILSAGSKPQGASWVGALDMSGNLWEWTSSVYADYPYDSGDGREEDVGDTTDGGYVLRGGSFLNSVNLLRAAFRLWNLPDIDFFDYGFRCARDY